MRASESQAMSPIEDHPLRFALANELHARPFPALEAPGFAAFLAIKQPQNAAGRDRADDLAHLVALLDRFGAPHPQPGATHYYGEIGRYGLKWECHSEFVTYTLMGEGATERAFDPAVFKLFPEDWLGQAPGKLITSGIIQVEPRPGADEIRQRLAEWFVPESMAAVEVLDGAGVVAGDFRFDPAGHQRFAVFVSEGITTRRVGRIVQRLCEIETYKTMAMLGHARAGSLTRQVGRIDDELAALVQDLGQGGSAPEEALGELLTLSSELEGMTAQTSFRFGATRAYEAIVLARIEVLRETRFEGRQTLGEFMTRRFDPAMRTVKATEHQLTAMAERATRAADLLRTQVDVERSAQSQVLLKSMDRRADLQLRLQETVEGLSVVAISYYAVSLGTYLLAPLAYGFGIEKSWLTAGLVLPVMGLVWLLGRRVKRRLHK
jgi:uncharacterized membrane-anchored protein